MMSEVLIGFFIGALMAASITFAITDSFEYREKQHLYESCKKVGNYVFPDNKRIIKCEVK